MQIIANGINGQYLQNFLLRSPKDLEWVKAAVAYANGSPDLLRFCSDNKIPLFFWGRVDDSFPVSSNILKKFLELGPGYECKLIHDYYHPKVIWFSGFGAYIGSANLTDRSWINNIECGIWFTQGDLENHNLITELDNYFDELDKYAEPLTDELFQRISALQNKYSNLRSELSIQKARLANDFSNDLKPIFSKSFEGLSRISSRKEAGERAKQKFIDEWTETLQRLRQISEEISKDENRPEWIHQDVPKGVQVDQFLHAFYYKNVKPANHSLHEQFYLKNKSNPVSALKKAIEWWKNSDQNEFSEEKEFIYERAPFLQKMLSKENITHLNEKEFIEVCLRVHAFITASRQTSNEEVGLPESTHLGIFERAEKVASWLWSQKSGNGSSATQILKYVLYSDVSKVITERIWDAVYTKEWHVHRLGLSCIGEIVGWAMPTQYPPRNGRTSKALHALGYKVKIYSE